jgi:hypothetical protein
MFNGCVQDCTRFHSFTTTRKRKNLAFDRKALYISVNHYTREYTMAAPVGNKNAVGNKGQPKRIYTPERLAEEAKALREWIMQPDNLYLKDFAHDRGYNPTRLDEHSRNSVEFASALQFAKDKQESKFIKHGLRKEYGMDAVKYFMPRMLQDRPEWKTSWDAPAETAEATPSTIIINKIEK